MAARLGRVLYWLGCAISIFVFVGTMVFVNAVAGGKPNASQYVFIAFCTAVPWVIGRALRYILAKLPRSCRQLQNIRLSSDVTNPLSRSRN